jgi:hypothetical protein
MLKKLKERALAAERNPQSALNSVVEGIRARGLLAGGGQLGGPCSREQLGDELFNAFQLLCSRTDFFGSFDQTTKVSPCSSRGLPGPRPLGIAAY